MPWCVPEVQGLGTVGRKLRRSTGPADRVPGITEWRGPVSDSETSQPDVRDQTPVVFFVDDEEAVRSMWSHVLRKHGYRVLEAGTAEEALWFIEAFTAPINVLLMDINLPDGWGASVAQRLREIHPEMSVVYTTGFADSDPILSSGLGDARFVLRKPSSNDKLIEVIGEACAESRHPDG